MSTRIGCLFVALLFAWILVVPAFAVEDEDTISVVSYYIPLLVEDSESGAFVVLLKEAAKRAGIKYELELYPTKRAMRLFEDGKVMAILPALLSTLSHDAALTEQIFIKKIHGFVKSGNPIPRKISELEGKRIGLVRGFSYPRSILVNERIMVDYADTTDSSLKKLEEGRIDVVVVDGYTAVHALDRLGLNGLEYDLSVALHSQPAFIAFQSTPEGEFLAAKMTKALLSMKEDGTYAAIVPKID